MAEYQSSRSVLDGHSSKALRNNQHTNLNRTMQVKKKSLHQNTTEGGGTSQIKQDSSTTAGGGHGSVIVPSQRGAQNREHISKSVLTNADRASPVPSSSANGIKVSKMNIKKNQIKLVTNIANKRSSIQASGSVATGGAGANSSTGGAGNQSKSVSRDSRIKVKLVGNKNTANVTVKGGGGYHA